MSFLPPNARALDTPHMSLLPPNAQTYDILSVLYKVTAEHIYTIALVTLVAPSVLAALSLPFARRNSTQPLSEERTPPTTAELFLALALEWADFLVLGLAAGFLIMVLTSVCLDWTSYMLPESSLSKIWGASTKDYDGHLVIGCVAFFLGIGTMAVACYHGLRRRGGQDVGSTYAYQYEKSGYKTALSEEV